MTIKFIEDLEVISDHETFNNYFVVNVHLNSKINDEKIIMCFTDVKQFDLYQNNKLIEVDEKKKKILLNTLLKRYIIIFNGIIYHYDIVEVEN